jgi:hypothetical protein
MSGVSRVVSGKAAVNIATQEESRLYIVPGTNPDAVTFSPAIITS